MVWEGPVDRHKLIATSLSDLVCDLTLEHSFFGELPQIAHNAIIWFYTRPLENVWEGCAPNKRTIHPTPFVESSGENGDRRKGFGLEK